MRTLEVKGRDGEIVKPAELIDVIGGSDLTLSARRTYNRLIANAMGPHMAIHGTQFRIATAELTDSHEGLDRLNADILALMRTVVVVRMSNGATRRVQLLGGNDLTDSGRERGWLQYSFDRRLIEVLELSRTYALLETRLLPCFASKYGLALYELVARRIRLTHVSSEEFHLKRLRELLGVPHGKIKLTGSLKQQVLTRSAREVNSLSPFEVTWEDVRRGNRIVAFRLHWRAKDPSADLDSVIA